MDRSELAKLLEDVSTGACSPDDAMARLRSLPFADLGFAKVDHHRALRQGLPEAIYGPGKTPEQCAALVVELLEGSTVAVLLTRASDDQVKAAIAGAAEAGFEGAAVTRAASHSTVVWRPASSRPGRVTIVTAGTADQVVAGECRAVLSGFGFEATLLVDCGVAGLHRLLASMPDVVDADVVVVIAGMEGALASVVGGLTAAPVIAVPTSAGYGAGLQGVTALLAMLASCASGITVVGIDNGYGAACAVARLLKG
jgi:NCAIR mutase (PurE)-related protein